MKMRYFQPNEFQGWFSYIDHRLLQMLDDFRHAWGKPIIVSPAKGAVGRSAGIHIRSFHNVDYHGLVRAVDLMPVGMTSAVAAMAAADLAKHCGFRGIGIYPHWKPQPGIHVDNRSQPATWGAINRSGTQEYTTFNDALAAFAA